VQAAEDAPPARGDPALERLRHRRAAGGAGKAQGFVVRPLLLGRRLRRQWRQLRRRAGAGGQHRAHFRIQSSLVRHTGSSRG
jgi:hypothetical protein